MPEKKLKLLDLLIIAIFIALIFASFLPKLFRGEGNATLTVISEDGEAVYSLAERSERSFEIISKGIKVGIVIKNGEAYIESSECPGGICMKASPVKNIGDTVICAPAGVALIVRSGGEADADALAG